MKILFITPSFFPQRGGTEQVIAELCKLISKTDQITILTQKRNKHWKSLEMIHGIEVHRVRPLPHYLGHFFHYELKQHQIVRKALELHKKHNFDIIHNFHVFEFSKAVNTLRKKLQLPIITSLMGWDSFDPVKKIPEHLIPPMTEVMNNSQVVTSPSSHLARAARDDQGCTQNVEIIPHGTAMFETPLLEDFDIYGKYQIPEDKKIFLSVQRLDKRKGLIYLIKSIPEIVKTHPDAYFVIAGKGPEQEFLQAKAKELKLDNYICWMGFVPDEELPNIYNIADFFLLPTLYEAFGLVYADALSFGVPVISTSNGGTDDIINEDNGLIFEKESVSAVVEAVDKAINTPWDKEGIIQDAQKFRWTTIAKQYASLYQQLHR